MEGLPDFLAAFDFLLRENRAGEVAPIAMLSATVAIDELQLSRFAGKHVRIYSHSDTPGIAGAERWGKQLGTVNATVDFFNFSKTRGGKDLADLNSALQTKPASVKLTEKVLP